MLTSEEMPEVVRAAAKARIGAWVEIRNNATGEVRRYYDDYFNPDPETGSRYIWTEGNYGCDCNRSLFFARAADEEDPEDLDCEGGVFTAIRAHCDNGTVMELDGEDADHADK